MSHIYLFKNFCTIRTLFYLSIHFIVLQFWDIKSADSLICYYFNHELIVTIITTCIVWFKQLHSHHHQFTTVKVLKVKRVRKVHEGLSSGQVTILIDHQAVNFRLMSYKQTFDLSKYRRSYGQPRLAMLQVSFRFGIYVWWCDFAFQDVVQFKLRFNKEVSTEWVQVGRYLQVNLCITFGYNTTPDSLCSNSCN